MATEASHRDNTATHASPKQVAAESPPSPERRERRITGRNEDALKIELKYLQDPFKLAEHVRYTLRNMDPDKALDLCRLASKRQEVIVAWNHCIDWFMSCGKPWQAISVYNEMKKRAQFPDSFTYILLLRGLAGANEQGDPLNWKRVTKAVSIYNSMSAPSSRVSPTIMHANAVLKVCSEGHDMDALWGVVARLPDKGPGSPDTLTYTIILIAIRHNAVGTGKDCDVLIEQLATRRHRALQDGKRIWQEIILKWRAGTLKIDERLVRAMGQLLSSCSYQMEDWDDVLSLVEQTMNIERLVPPIGSLDRNTQHLPPSDTRFAEEPPEDNEGYKEVPARKVFNRVRPLVAMGSHKHGSLDYAQPGNMTLSMLIGACELLRIPKTAIAYWNLLTDLEGPYRLRPDKPNYNALLRLYGKNRSSAQAAKLINTLPDQGAEISPTTFRIAMSVCMRDKYNPNTLSHARQIVDVMEKHCPDPDAYALMQYLSLALMTDDGPTIVATVDRLDSLIHNLKSRVLYGTDSTRMTTVQHVDNKRDIIVFFQTIVGAIDTLMNRGFVPREDFNAWHARRQVLDQFIGRAKSRMPPTEDGPQQPTASGTIGSQNRVRAAGKNWGQTRNSREWAIGKSLQEASRFRYRTRSPPRVRMSEAARDKMQGWDSQEFKTGRTIAGVGNGAARGGFAKRSKPA